VISITILSSSNVQ